MKKYLKAVVSGLCADALQGYFLAKPAAVPAKMAPAARKVIAEYSSASDNG